MLHRKQRERASALEESAQIAERELSDKPIGYIDSMPKYNASYGILGDYAILGGSVICFLNAVSSKPNLGTYIFGAVLFAGGVASEVIGHIRNSRVHHKWKDLATHLAETAYPDKFKIRN
jgi:hypothetical protein